MFHRPELLRPVFPRAVFPRAMFSRGDVPPGGVPSGSGPTRDPKAVAEHRLRSIIAVIDTPSMRQDLRRLIDWIAAYLCPPPGEVMRMALRVLRPDAPGVQLASRRRRYNGQ